MAALTARCSSSGLGGSTGCPLQRECDRAHRVVSVVIPRPPLSPCVRQCHVRAREHPAQVRIHPVARTGLLARPACGAGVQGLLLVTAETGSWVKEL